MATQANHKLQHGGGEESEADFFRGLRCCSVSWHSWHNCVCFRLYVVGYCGLCKIGTDG